MVWPLVDQMNPDASVRALASIEVDITSLEEGAEHHSQMARQPGFHPLPDTDKEIEDARVGTDLGDLKSTAWRAMPIPRTTQRRRPTKTVPTNEKIHRHGWRLYASGVRPARRGRATINGWYCPCHASHYDTVRTHSTKGRRRRTFRYRSTSSLTDTKLKIG